MSGVFSQLKPVNHTPKNGFDLSRFTTFSAKTGVHMPIFHQMTIPGSQYQLDLQQLCRTQPLQTAAFTGFSLNYDIIFTPLNHLYSSFNQFISQRENKNLVTQPSNKEVPNFALDQFLYFVLPFACYDYLMQMLFPTRESFVVALEQDSEILPYIVCYSEQSPNTSVSLSIIRSLDLYGYGNYLPLVKEVVNHIYSNGAFQGVKKTGKDFVYSMFMIQQDGNWNDGPFYSVVRAILDGKNYASNVVVVPQLFNTSQLANMRDVFFTLWPVLAYNKSFHEYYRNTYYDLQYNLYFVSSDYETLHYQYDYVQLFNMDDSPDMKNLDFEFSHTREDEIFMRLVAMFSLKPVLYKRDLFTGVLPSTQFGDVSVFTETDTWKTLISRVSDSVEVPYEDTIKNEILSKDANYTYGSLTSSGSGVQFKFDPAVAISVLEQRRADAMQRFRERMLRAGDKVKDIFKAQGWDAPVSEKSYEPIFLGSYDGRLDINTVASTTQNADADLGQLAANGVSVVNGHKIKIKAEDFGIIQIIFHIGKEAVYNSFGVNPQHCMLEPFDFPYPVLQNISLAPVTSDALQFGYSFNSSDIGKPTDIYGYLPRFMQFKTAVDEVHGEFYDKLPSSFASAYAISTQGVFADWVSQRSNYSALHDLSFLYMHPSDSDSVFKVRSNDLQETDQFIINCHVDCYAVQPLSVIGLPV